MESVTLRKKRSTDKIERKVYVVCILKNAITFINKLNDVGICK